jgi:hypothetical protein
MGYLLAFILMIPAVQQVPAVTAEPLHQVLQHLERESGYRFLYKDALVADKSTALVYSDEWQDELLTELKKWQLSARIDPDRKQVIIYEDRSQERLGDFKISGQIIDKLSGEQLPFATLRMLTGSGKQFVSQSDQHGRFEIRVPEGEEEVLLKVTYIGYEDTSIELGRESIDQVNELNIRIKPSAYQISEIVVTGSGNRASEGSIYRGVLEAGSFSAAGESNSIRSLTLLPSVGSGTALSDGAHIRGSSSDAVHVLLDNSVIYNRSHLFGLIDSFNSDIIRTGSFYYDVAPARFHAPPGGVLSLVTKTGSLHRYGGGLGVSSSVVKGSLEGPLKKGKSSFLVAGRKSIINQVNIFGMDDMIAWGLDTDRPSSLTEESTSLEDRIVRPLDSSANFFDLHAKIFFENSPGNRWSLSGYAGGDRTKQETERFVRTGFNSPGNRFDWQEFLAKNTWGNSSFNLSHYRDLAGRNAFMHFQGGFSYYYTGMIKEDFVYQRPGLNGGQQLLFVDLFENESELNHAYLSGEINTGKLTAGVSLNFFDSRYREDSLNRPDFFQDSSPFLPELYFDIETGNGEAYSVQGGVRMQYYSDGDYLNLSPRFKLSLFRDRPVSVSLGFSRNFQYLYKLSIYNLSAADIWITAVADQPPARSDLLSGGLYFNLWEGAQFQTEGYIKWQENLRHHEINIQNLDISFEEQPWFSNNEGFARGIEFLFSQRFGRAMISQSYTLSSTEMKNERLNEGNWFYSEWDRRHQVKTLLQISPYEGFDIHVSWNYLSGAPDRLTLFQDSPERLGSYIRTDLSLSYTTEVSGTGIVLRGNLYNLTNRQNPWYREWVPTISTDQDRNRLEPVQADIYDLGFQPSFSAQINF